MKLLLKIIMLFAFGVISLIIGFFIGRFSKGMNSELFTLEKSYKIRSDFGEGILPKGTTLFYEESMPEGFDVYKIYINYKGIPLKFSKSKKKWFRDPIWLDNEDGLINLSIESFKSNH